MVFLNPHQLDAAAAMGEAALKFKKELERALEGPGLKSVKVRLGKGSLFSKGIAMRDVIDVLPRLARLE